jgi:hypothetical protein
MGIENTKEKYIQPIHNWSLTISNLYFEGKLDNYLEL